MTAANHTNHAPSLPPADLLAILTALAPDTTHADRPYDGDEPDPSGEYVDGDWAAAVDAYYTQRSGEWFT